MKLTIKEQLVLNELNLRLSRLIALDSIWTGYLEETKRPKKRDIRQLEEIVREMELLLDSVAFVSGKSFSILLKHKRTINRNFDRAFKKVPASKAKKYYKKRLLGFRGSFVDALVANGKNCIRSIPAEKAILDHKINLLQTGAFTSGDVSKKWLEAALEVAAALVALKGKDYTEAALAAAKAADAAYDAYQEDFGNGGAGSSTGGGSSGGGSGGSTSSGGTGGSTGGGTSGGHDDGAPPRSGGGGGGSSSGGKPKPRPALPK